MNEVRNIIIGGMAHMVMIHERRVWREKSE